VVVRPHSSAPVLPRRPGPLEGAIEPAVELPAEEQLNEDGSASGRPIGHTEFLLHWPVFASVFALTIECGISVTVAVQLLMVSGSAGDGLRQHCLRRTRRSVFREFFTPRQNERLPTRCDKAGASMSSHGPPTTQRTSEIEIRRGRDRFKPITDRAVVQRGSPGLQFVFSIESTRIVMDWRVRTGFLCRLPGGQPGSLAARYRPPSTNSD
jgi:hypothetical protein